MLSLIEKAEQTLDDKKAEELERKLRKNKFDMNDLLVEMAEIQKLGSMKDLISMIPGMSKKVDLDSVDENAFKKTSSIIYSMTKKEREHPDIINASRKKRIAAGCGMTVEDVNKLLNQFKQMQKMFKEMNGKKGRKQMKRMQMQMQRNGQLPKN